MAVSSSLISRSSLLDPLCGLPFGVGGLPFWPSRVSTLTIFFVCIAVGFVRLPSFILMHYLKLDLDLTALHGQITAR